MRPVYVILAIILCVIAASGGWLWTRTVPQQQTLPNVQLAEPQKEPDKAETLIHFQANDKCIVKLNDREIGFGAGMKATTLSGGTTKKGDVLTFIVTNDDGWGGLRAVVKRGDEETYKTGQEEFSLVGDDAQWVLVKDTQFGEVAKKEWAPFETDAPVALMGAEWIWNENGCSKCVALFRLVL